MDIKKIKKIKRTLTRRILRRMNFDRYPLVIEEKVLYISSHTKFIPAEWVAGIEGNPLEFGWGGFSRPEFASEEAKRILRDMFPEKARLITWAWYH